MASVDTVKGIQTRREIFCVMLVKQIKSGAIQTLDICMRL